MPRPSASSNHVPVAVIVLLAEGRLEQGFGNLSTNSRAQSSAWRALA
jgi:hypothetical protein